MMIINRHAKLCLNLQVLSISLVTAMATLSANAEEVITIEGTQIKGNQESPTILYVIPWQAPEIEELDQSGSIRPIQSTVAPLERSEFRRLIDYHEHFKRVFAEPPSDPQ